MNLAAWRAYGKKLKKAVAAGICVVGREPNYECGWDTGGCLVAARATAQVTGGEVWGVVETTMHGGIHAVVRTPDGFGFLDADGFSTRPELRRRWEHALAVALESTLAKRRPDVVYGPQPRRRAVVRPGSETVLMHLQCRESLVDQVAPLLPRLPGAPGSEIELDCEPHVDYLDESIPRENLPSPLGWDYITECTFTYRAGRGDGARGRRIGDVRGAFVYTRSDYDQPYGLQLHISQLYAHPPHRGLGEKALRALRDRFSWITLRQRQYPTIVLTTIETEDGRRFGQRMVEKGLVKVAFDINDTVLATDSDEIFGPVEAP